MTEQHKAELIVAGAAIFVTIGATVLVGNIRHAIRKRRKCEPLPGTTKVEKIYIIKTPKK